MNSESDAGPCLPAGGYLMLDAGKNKPQTTHHKQNHILFLTVDVVGDYL
ncbi:MAG: hypothetical protein IPM56_17385 [Ignavibacteriales bacterium]|nr:MAG: hypothetical protein IPM56_17385 [Ignavibacteriales bacterium]